MRVGLIIPPGSSLMPYPAIPYLASCLNSAGHISVVHDFNLIAFNQFLERQGISIGSGVISIKNPPDSDYIIPDIYLRSTIEASIQAFEVIMLEESIRRLRLEEKVAVELRWYSSTSRNNYFSDNINSDLSECEIDHYIDSINKVNISWIDNVCLDRDMSVIGIHVINSLSLLWSVIIAEEIKKRRPELLVILGGHRLSSDLLSRYAQLDAIAVGESEYTIVEIADNYTGDISSISTIHGIIYRDPRGAIIATPPRALLYDINGLPFPDYQCLSTGDYPQQKFGINVMPVVGSRGCIAKCAFCYEWVIGKGRYRLRSPRNIIEEITQLKQKHSTEYIRFNDSLINGSIKSIETFCELLISENIGIEWLANARIRPEMNRSLLQKMRKSGCRALWYGLESGSNDVLSRMNKKINLDTVSRVVKETAESGIFVLLFVIVGFPGESYDEFKKTADFIICNAKYIDALVVSQFNIIPGTVIEQQPERFSILTTTIHESPFTKYYTFSPSIKENRRDILRDIWKQASHRNSGTFPFIQIIPSL